MGFAEGEEAGAGEGGGDAGLPALVAEGGGGGEDEVDLGDDARGLVEAEDELHGDLAAGEGAGGVALGVGEKEDVEQFLAPLDFLQETTVKGGGDAAAAAVGVAELEAGGIDDAPLGAADGDAGLDGGKIAKEGEVGAEGDAQGFAGGRGRRDEGELALEGHDEAEFLEAAGEVELLGLELQFEGAAFEFGFARGAGVAQNLVDEDELGAEAGGEGGDLFAAGGAGGLAGVEIGEGGVGGDAGEHVGLAEQLGAAFGEFGGGAGEIEAEFGLIFFLEEGAGERDGLAFELEAFGVEFAPDGAFGETRAGGGEAEGEKAVGGGFDADAADGLHVGGESGEDEFGGLGVAGGVEGSRGGAGGGENDECRKSNDEWKEEAAEAHGGLGFGRGLGGGGREVDGFPVGAGPAGFVEDPEEVFEAGAFEEEGGALFV